MEIKLLAMLMRMERVWSEMALLVTITVVVRDTC